MGEIKSFVQDPTSSKLSRWLSDPVLWYSSSVLSWYGGFVLLPWECLTNERNEVCKSFMKKTPDCILGSSPLTFINLYIAFFCVWGLSRSQWWLHENFSCTQTLMSDLWKMVVNKYSKLCYECLKISKKFIAERIIDKIVKIQEQPKQTTKDMMMPGIGVKINLGKFLSTQGGILILTWIFFSSGSVNEYPFSSLKFPFFLLSFQSP